MSRDCPELIFVAGPQTGQRVQLRQPAAILGRGGEADILLSEEYASRQQLRYEVLKAGPTLENLSSRGTWINGKRFKKGKRVLVETGDLIGVGAQTQILFVGVGDDPDQALAAYKQAAGGRDAFGQRPAPPAPQPPPPQADQDHPPQHDQTDQTGEDREKRPSEMTPGERAELERKARQKKILIGVAAWWVVVGVVIVLGALLRTGGPDADKVVPVLDESEIRRLLEDPPKELIPSRDDWLTRAMKLYDDHGLENPWKLSETVTAFKQALAYNGRSSFEAFEHQSRYRKTVERFTQEVTDRYANACGLEKKEDWTEARQAFTDILEILGDRNYKNPIFKNVQAHHTRTKQFEQAEQRARKGRGWFD